MFSLLFIIVLSLFRPSTTQAADQNYVMPIVPLRTPALWREGSDFRHLYAIRDIATRSSLPVTWLVHYDILKDPQMVTFLKNLPKNNEIGIFLEVTQRLASDSNVFFDWLNGPWSSPHKLYLQGYQRDERERLLQTFFDTYKNVFGSYPKSYGAWYIDGYSGEYIKNHFGAKMQLGLADQYSTDGYQVWGQHVDQPYYQDESSVIEPAKEPGDHILKVLWAPREPTLSYGESVEYSNFSLQSNDYYRSKGLPHSYFEQTLKTLTQDTLSPVSGIVIGLEVGEVKSEFLAEFQNQLKTLSDLQKQNKVKVVSMADFESQYREKFSTTPNSFIQSYQKDSSSFWYQTPHYRAGLFINGSDLYLADLRFYHHSRLKDNDQLFKEASYNLSRVVPALVDQVSLHNSILLEKNTKAPQITGTTSSDITIKFKDLQVSFTSDKIIIKGGQALDTRPYPFITNNADSVVIAEPQKKQITNSRCSNSYGYFDNGFGCAKSIVQKILARFPNIVYTNLSGTHILGMRTSLTSIYALTFPKLSIGPKTFDAQIMGSFIDLKQKITPKFAWYGRQEDEVPVEIRSKVIEKNFEKYGQEQILELIHKPKIFENGRYFVPKP
jgi:hypothetical protein